MMEQRIKASRALYEEACSLIPGGVNSPVRAFGQVGGTPLFIDRAEGPFMWDADGNRYIDYIGSWGPMILGHGHPEVVKEVQATMQRGFSFGAPTGRESALARKVMQFMPNIEMVRFVSSGTEACMSALRVARAYTKRDKIIKFNGCYHGHADMLLVKAGSGVATLGIPGSPGVPKEATMHTLVAPFNDLAAVDKLFAEHKDSIAAIIIEPIVGNAGFIRPLPGYLEGLRRISSAQGALLIFDEVMTGFRVHPGGVQGLLGIKPDLSTLGKVIGGGLPIAAYGGKKEIMASVAPVGPVYQAGTLSGNPLAVSSGLKTLEVLEKQDFKDLHRRTRRLIDGLREAAQAAKVPFSGDVEGGMFGFNFCAKPITNFAEAQAADIPLFNRFFHAMLKRGVYLAPSAYEAGFVSFAHTDALIDETVKAAREAFAEIVPR